MGQVGYSQNEEEKYILEYFHNFNNGRGGKFIEIGAFSPKELSNTRALYERGFTGCYVEPSPSCFKSFVEEYAKEPRIQLLNYAITAQDGTMKFYDSGGDAVSTSSIDHKDKWERGSTVRFTEIEVNTMSMNRFLNQYGQETDFLSLDVESSNFELFNLLPDDFLHRLKMICIEHDGYYVQMEQKLTPFGFRKIHMNGENLIMAK